MTTTRKPSARQRRAALGRLRALRDAGVPGLISAHAAWHLSGGILGARDDATAFPTSRIALLVPDCLAFLPDYEAVPPARRAYLEV